MDSNMLYKGESGNLLARWSDTPGGNTIIGQVVGPPSPFLSLLAAALLCDDPSIRCSGRGIVLGESRAPSLPGGHGQPLLCDPRAEFFCPADQG